MFGLLKTIEKQQDVAMRWSTFPNAKESGKYHPRLLYKFKDNALPLVILENWKSSGRPFILAKVKRVGL